MTTYFFPRWAGQRHAEAGKTANPPSKELFDFRSEEEIEEECREYESAYNSELLRQIAENGKHDD